MITEMDKVILLEDLPEYRLKAGDIGTVIDVYEDEYTVMFVRRDKRRLIPVDVAPYLVRRHDPNDQYARA